MRRPILILLCIAVFTAFALGDSKETHFDGKETYLIYVQIPGKIQPLDRSKKYDDPIDVALKSLKLGEVSGGGTEFNPKTREITFADTDVDVINIDLALPVIKGVLKAQKAPRGTTLECHYPSGIKKFSLYDDEWNRGWLLGLFGVTVCVVVGFLIARKSRE